MWEPDWTRRDRTVLQIISARRYSDQELFASQLFPASRIVDWRLDFLARARPRQRRLGVTVATEIRRLQELVDSERMVFSIINTEYLLARFSERERENFWLSMWSDFPHAKGFVIFTTLDSRALLPSSLDLQSWEQDGRLVDRSSDV